MEKDAASKRAGGVKGMGPSLVSVYQHTQRRSRRCEVYEHSRFRRNPNPLRRGNNPKNETAIHSRFSTLRTVILKHCGSAIHHIHPDEK